MLRAIVLTDHWQSWITNYWLIYPRVQTDQGTTCTNISEMFMESVQIVNLYLVFLQSFGFCFWSWSNGLVEVMWAEMYKISLLRWVCGFPESKIISYISWWFMIQIMIQRWNVFCVTKESWQLYLEFLDISDGCLCFIYPAVL